MKRFIFSMTLIAILFGVGFIYGCSNSTGGQDESEEAENAKNENVEEKTILVVGHTEPENGSYQGGLEKFKELVEDESGGTIEVQIHANGSLGAGDGELIQKVSSGTIDMTTVAAPGLSQSVPEVGLLSVPYMFEGRDHWEEVIDGEVGDEYIDIIESSTDMKVLGWQIRGVRNYFGNTPINFPEDLKGIKIRLMDDPSIFKIWSSWGANPTSVPASEQYQALQNGVMDAAEADFINIYTNKYHEVTSHISLTEHSVLTSLFIMNQSNFDELSEKQQTAVEKAGIEASKYQREVDRDLNEKYLEQLKEEGVEINEVNKEEFKNSIEDERQEIIEEYELEEMGKKILNYNK